MEKGELIVEFLLYPRICYISMTYAAHTFAARNTYCGSRIGEEVYRSM